MSYHRHQLIVALLFSALVIFSVSAPVAAAGEQGSNKTHPNLVIILADDLGYGDLSCYGNKEFNTPRLDQMAAEGARLTDFYVGCSVCSPSRAALLTGKMPQRVGIPQVLSPMSTTGLLSSQVTIAEMLKKQGYATGLIGKWHLGHLPQFLPTRHGFDYYFGLPYSNDMKPAPLMRGERIIEPEVEQTTITPRYTQEALQFIDRSTSAGAPFFLYFAHTYPHVPLHTSTAFTGHSHSRLYGDVVQELDWSVGHVLDHLRDRGLDKNTLVVFFSDNGPWLTQGRNAGSAGPLRDGKFTAYEGGIREPFIAWWPGVLTPGREVNTPVVSMDIFPTFCKLSGATLPEGKRDGMDVWNVIKGESKNPDRALFFPDPAAKDPVGAVRLGKWKLIAEYRNLPGARRLKNGTRTTTEPELYDLAADTGERHNLAQQHPDIVAQLTARANAIRDELVMEDPYKGAGDPKSSESLNYLTPGKPGFYGDRTVTPVPSGAR